jgi:hypothetical protein
VLAEPQAAWRADEVPAEGARAVKGRWSDAWAREEQEVARGGRKWRAVAQQQRNRGAEETPEEGGGRKRSEGLNWNLQQL